MSSKKHKHELSQHKYKRRSELLPTFKWHQLEPPTWGGEESFLLRPDVTS